MESPIDTPQPILRAVGVYRNFKMKDEEVKVLKGIDLEIAKGEFVAIMGKSGSGKSTLLSILATLDRPTEGKVFFKEREMQILSEDGLSEFRRTHFGFIFQAYHLIPSLTAIENVQMPADLAGIPHSGARAKELLDRVGLSHRLQHYPRQLSGGEQQRISICRALINNPEVIFADEPTGNLDSESGQIIVDMLLSLRGQRSLILVTHDKDLARLADRVVEMQDGRLIEGDMKNYAHQAR